MRPTFTQRSWTIEDDDNDELLINYCYIAHGSTE